MLTTMLNLPGERVLPSPDIYSEHQFRPSLCWYSRKLGRVASTILLLLYKLEQWQAITS